MSQPDMFGSATPQPVRTIPDVETVRARLGAVLAQLKEADSMPWTEAQAKSWRVVGPQMSKWLPEDERTAFRTEFDAEIARLLSKAA